MSSRRRMRVVSSSDEEDEDFVQQAQPPPPPHHHIEIEDDIESDLQDSTLNLENVTLNSLNPNPSSISDPIQVEISDEDFVDVSEDLSPSPPPQPPPSTVQQQPGFSSEASSTSGVSLGEAFGCPISRVLQGLGLRLRREWLDSCIHGLQEAIPRFSSFDDTKKAKLCFEQFLNCDMNKAGAGVLPENVHQMHLVDLPGPFVLQVDEIVNISQPLRDRYKKAASGLKRCLKLSMTDGVQQVFGMEYQPIKDLEALAPAGLKVAISNVHVRHGLLMLVPEVIQILGGLVEELDAARQRLVNEVHKPPRGRRTRAGVVPPLATRASLAAWPRNDVRVSGHSNPMPQGATPFQPDNQGTASAPATGRAASDSSVPIHRGNVEYHQPRAVPESAIPFPREKAELHPSRARVDGSFPIRNHNASFAIPTLRENVTTSRVIDSEEVDVLFHEGNAETFVSPVAVSDDMDTSMVDAVERLSTITRDRESPFTYLARLSVEWAASKDKASHVQGKIKCFFTGVKGFQHKQRSTYELQVYIDDGSLISEVIIDHSVVQKLIGYSPEELNAALSSSDQRRVCDMKETMKQFQNFLVNFEGTMLVRINEASPLPVAIDMHQGSSLSDAWLLLRRLKSSYSDQSPHPQLGPISISP